MRGLHLMSRTSKLRRLAEKRKAEPSTGLRGLVDEAMAEAPMIAIPVIVTLVAAGAGVFFVSQAIHWNRKLVEKRPEKEKGPPLRTALSKFGNPV
jgi:hypothetical protein